MFSNRSVQFYKINLRKVNFFVLVVTFLLVASFCTGLPNNSKDLKKFEKHEEDANKEGKTMHHLNRRLSSTMVPIRDRETTSLCLYEVITDFNAQRVPDKIDRVLCKKSSCKCKEQGDFRCTQLYSQLNITYLTNQNRPSLEFDVINVEYACVCSTTPGGTNINLLEPVLV